MAEASEAERRVFLSPRGGLLVQVVGLVVQVPCRKEQQQAMQKE